MCSQVDCKYREFCEDGKRKDIEAADLLELAKVFGLTIHNRKLVKTIVNKEQEKGGYNKCFR